MAKVPNENLPLSAIGMFPSDWQEATLASICHQVTDGTHDSPKPVAEGGFPLVTGKAIKDRRIDFAVTYNISEEDHRQVLARSKAEEGDILFANIGNSIGDLVRVQTSRPFSIKNVALFKPNQEKVDPRYLEYYFLSEQVQTFIKGTTRGSAQPFIGLSSLRGFPIALPQMNEQIGIGSILGVLDDRIVLLRETNATLEAMAQALFKSWFVDFDPVHARARGEQLAGLAPEVAALFPDSFEETALGMVPKGWQAEPLDEIAEFLNGLALQKYPPDGDETLPVIKIAQLRKGDTVGADRASRNIKPEYIIQNGDVLFSWSGSLEVKVWCGGEGALNQHLFKVTSQRFQKWFYLRWTKTHLTNFKHIAASKATTMGHIQRKHLTEAMVVVPSSQVLAEADKIFGPLLDQWINNAEQAQTLANLRDTLLPRLISGQLRLPDAEQQLKDLAV
ncbi:restriction endonuclease subunit S [Aeromonas dhakensis]|uniref:restriction endonuclease subunit S n=1 Tax=Aeromonas dhakensis TaxID=196024 RepID=UPI000B2C6EF7|nr:restriction endonuclease subunit S [Aeromonas dhakensis]